ncbi:styrene monooxygenase/indole monooxygenase family protein [Nocardia sp. NPDC049149]|uniref:styrene monooxygenase/indole monooxygenase family protein n=1 Tax=Nocardia sp. NPDC049149 TaxID=3364315 RepID=UPI0037163D33
MGQVLILGAGECGLPLAHRLLRGGVAVTLLTNRDAEAVLAGGVTSTQVKFAPTLELESDAGIGMWRTSAPQINGIRFTMVVDRQPVVQWMGKLSRPAQSVDQRTVFARWLAEVEAAGGELRIVDPSIEQLDRYAAEHELTIVTKATGMLADRFAPDPAWVTPPAPQRRLAVLYLFGVPADPDDFGSYTVLPGHGEVISYRGLTGLPGREQQCEMLLFEAVPGGCLDVFGTELSAGERLGHAMRLLAAHLPPGTAERYATAELTDSGATLVGAVTPSMRRPIGSLPSGRPILGGGDVVCRMDPGGAQGANNAAHCAAHYAAAILGHRGGPFDRPWMDAVAAQWLTDIAHPAARWTEALLDPPPPLQQLVVAAQQDPVLANTFADTFARPAAMADLAVRLGHADAD